MADVENAPETAAGSTQREERQCYICLEVSEVEVEDRGWVSPCRCTGTMAWVHQECLLRWVHELEQHNAPPACAQCRTRYVLLPAKGVLLSTLDLVYKHIVPVCKYMAGCVITIVAIDSACATMGVFALTQVYGLDETLVMLMGYEDPYDATVYLQLIIYSLIFISYLPWEDWLLQVLRKSSRLPLLRAVLPADLPVHFHEPPRNKSTMRILADALMLPVFANVVGTLFFSSVESPLSRALVGGAVYLTLQCGFSMYLRQKRMIRRQNIRVLPVEEIAEAGQ